MVTDMKFINPPRGLDPEPTDQTRLRHARDRHLGFSVGRFLQPPPMLFTRDGHNVFLGDMYRGHAAFLLCSGPSLARHDLSQLTQRGMLTMAVNNAATVFRPHLWCSVDDPGNFSDAIWFDPGILKFVPLCHMEKNFTVRDENQELVESKEVVGDMPGVFGFRRNENFVAEQWLYEDTFNWGNHGHKFDAYSQKGARSVFYVALRLLFYLGIRRLYLLGCDFRMHVGQANYAFPQDRSSSAVRGNNRSYEVLNVRLSHLLPYFEQEGFEVFNCTPDSGLTVFPEMPFERAVAEASAVIPRQIITAGMYDRNQRKKDAVEPVADAVVVQRAAESYAEEGYPRATLVTKVDRHTTATLACTWPTWLRFKPWLRTLPLLVCHDEALDPQAPEFDFLLDHPIVDFAACRRSDRDGTSRRRSHADALRLIAERVDNPWYLLLSPEAIATACERWLEPGWFEADDDGRLAAYIADATSYSRPAEAIARLDDWGDSVRGLRRRRRLNLAYQPGDQRVYHDAIRSWCLFANTDWTREIVRYAPHELPCESLGTYFFYCAARRGDRTLRVTMNDFGWEHFLGGQQQPHSAEAAVHE
jgi:hypothetical protein